MNDLDVDEVDDVDDVVFGWNIHLLFVHLILFNTDFQLDTSLLTLDYRDYSEWMNVLVISIDDENDVSMLTMMNNLNHCWCFCCLLNEENRK